MKLKVIKQEDYGTVVKLTVQAGSLRERFSFNPSQIKDGSWKEVVKEWAERKREKSKSIEGKEFEV